MEHTSCIKLAHSRVIDIFKVVVYFVGITAIVCAKKDDLSKGESLTEMTMMGPLERPLQSGLDGVWQPVAGTRNNFFVYSAFTDHRHSATIRVIAITKRTRRDRVFCRLWLSENRRYLLPANTMPMLEDYLPHQGTFVLCHLEDTGLKPNDVIGGQLSVVSWTRAKGSSTNFLQVNVGAMPLVNKQANIRVCVRPLFNVFDKAESLLEWIEVNRFLGVTDFMMYDKSLSSQAKCVLDYYKWKGYVTLLNWNLPVKLWEEGQIVAVNDCLYRSMSTIDWLIAIDHDEVIAPHYEGINVWKNYGDKSTRPYIAIFETLGVKNNQSDGLLFQNAFFYQGWQDDPEAPNPLITARKTRRTKKFLPYGEHSKYAVRPYNIIELNVHHIAEFLVPGYFNNLEVDPRYALLHHYKEKCNMSCLNSPSKIDRTAHKWAKFVWRRIKTKLMDLVHCQLNFNDINTYDNSKYLVLGRQ